VLLVEDDNNDERLAILGLRKAGISTRIEVARDGAAALDLLARSPEEFSLILLDLKLPKVSGLDVLAYIHKSFGPDGPPVIVFTSSDEPVDIARSMDLGASQFVTKPIEFNSYLAIVRRIAEEWFTGDLRQPEQASAS
jgi:DNA-binding response OmpR family regulator